MITTYEKYMKMTTKQLIKLEPKLQSRYAKEIKELREGDAYNFNGVDYAHREWETCRNVLMIKGVVC